MTLTQCLFLFFFFNDTATTEIYTLSLHDALPISVTATNIETNIKTTARSNAEGNYTIAQLKEGTYTVRAAAAGFQSRSEEHTSELQSRPHLVCRLLLEKKK